MGLSFRPARDCHILGALRVKLPACKNHSRAWKEMKLGWSFSAIVSERVLDPRGSSKKKVKLQQPQVCKHCGGLPISAESTACLGLPPSCSAPGQKDRGCFCHFEFHVGSGIKHRRLQIRRRGMPLLASTTSIKSYPPLQDLSSPLKLGNSSEVFLVWQA